MIKYINDALKHRNGEKGFSLVELVVVVAILGVLVVVAIPVFGAVQSNARGNTLTTAAHNAASSVASALAQGASKSDLTSTAVDAKHNVITKLNAQHKRKIAFTLAKDPSATPAESITTSIARPQANTDANTTVGTGTQKIAKNDSTETIFVYAADVSGNWIGVGTGQPDHKRASWL